MPTGQQATLRLRGHSHVEAWIGCRGDEGLLVAGEHGRGQVLGVGQCLAAAGHGRRGACIGGWKVEFRPQGGIEGTSVV